MQISKPHSQINWQETLGRETGTQPFSWAPQGLTLRNTAWLVPSHPKPHWTFCFRLTLQPLPGPRAPGCLSLSDQESQAGVPGKFTLREGKGEPWFAAFAWWKYAHHSGFQAPSVMSLNTELGKDGHTQSFSRRGCSTPEFTALVSLAVILREPSLPLVLIEMTVMRSTLY